MHFEGPYAAVGYLLDESGVYAVLDRPRDELRYRVIDIGESDRIRSRVAYHDRRWCWDLHAKGRRAFAALYVNDSDGGRQRRRIEQYIRKSGTIPCGVE